MTKLSILDLVPVKEGFSISDALAEAAEMAQLAEKHGFTRYWIAEHHGLKGVGSAATSVVIGHVAAATNTIRVGAGGIMLPNHPPLIIAEQFGTLDALYPGRIDLGLGRAPGGDMASARALRRPQRNEEDAFVQDILALKSYFADDGQLPVTAVPGAGADIPFYILGSSLFGAQVAAALGMPYAFASHFAPQMLDQALQIYRDRFEPSEQLDKPYVIAAMNVVAADSDEEAGFLASSIEQTFISLRTGNPGRMPPPVEGYRDTLPAQGKAMLNNLFECAAIGGPETVARSVEAFAARTKADEIICPMSIYDPDKRKRSLSILAETCLAEAA